MLGISSSGVVGEAGAPLHPLLSSVTYLSSTGGPTAVFEQRCPLVLKSNPDPDPNPNPNPNPDPNPSPNSPSPNPNPNQGEPPG